MQRMCALITTLLVGSIPGLCAAQAQARVSTTPPPPPASARDAPARRYAAGSISLTGSVLFRSEGVVYSAIPLDATGVNVGFDVAPRFVAHGLVLQPAMGTSFGASHSTFSTGTTPVQQSTVGVAFFAGVGVGWAVAVASHVALTPIASFAFSASTNWITNTPPTGGLPGTRELRAPPLYTVTLDLPVTIFASRNVFFEPFVSARLLIPSGAEVLLDVSIGQRVGWTF